MASKGDRKGSYRYLVGGTSGNRQFGRPKRRWEVIKMDLKEMGWEGVECIDLAKDRNGLMWLTTGRSGIL